MSENNSDSSSPSQGNDGQEELMFGFIVVGAFFVVLAIVAFAVVMAWRIRARELQSREAVMEQKKIAKVKKIESCLVSKVWTDSLPEKIEDKTIPIDLEAQQMVDPDPLENVCNVDTNVLTCQADGSDDDEDDNIQKQGGVCAICLGPYHDGELVVQACNRDCHHVFHRECIAEWLAKKDECPCCRQSFLTEETPQI